jgi:uncharacterized protein (DUF433 family)
MSTSVLSRDPEVMGGTAVFPATRVPVQTLLDYLEAGETIDDFLEGFPTVKRELAAEHFDVFVTVDRNLSFQQSLTSLPIAVVILHAKTN